MSTASAAPAPTAQATTTEANLGWLSIARLGLVQASIGAIVVLTTSTLNRVMVVELSLPALLPGLLLALHYAVQIARPRMGHGSDTGPRRTPWILGGMGVLASGGVLATAATVWMGSQTLPGIALALLAFVLIGLGVAAAGTSLLALLAQRVAPTRRAAAATLVWIMMIAGFVITAGTAGHLLEPYSPERLFAVACGVCGCAWLLTTLALLGLEGAPRPRPVSTQPAVSPPAVLPGAQDAPDSARSGFRLALREVWAEDQARRFTVFVFLSMLAYSAQDLILEPFAGLVFGLTPGASTRLSGVQHAGALLGMLMAAAAGSRFAGRHWGSLRSWVVGGCLSSALVLAALPLAASLPAVWPLKLHVFALGLCTGAFSIAAIASMMRLAGQGRPGSEGLRMGLWGAAQALAFALGGVLGTGLSDLARWALGSPAAAYGLVFVLEALLFVLAARLSMHLETPAGVAPAKPVRRAHEATGML